MDGPLCIMAMKMRKKIIITLESVGVGVGDHLDEKMGIRMVTLMVDGDTVMVDMLKGMVGNILKGMADTPKATVGNILMDIVKKNMDIRKDIVGK